MKQLIKFLLSNNLENLEELKLNGEIVVDKSLFIDALSNPDVIKPKKAAATKTKKAAAKESPFDNEDIKIILNNLNIKEFNLSTPADKVSLKFDLSKGGGAFESSE